MSDVVNVYLFIVRVKMYFIFRCCLIMYCQSGVVLHFYMSYIMCVVVVKKHVC